MMKQININTFINKMQTTINELTLLSNTCCNTLHIPLPYHPSQSSNNECRVSKGTPLGRVVDSIVDYEKLKK